MTTIEDPAAPNPIALSSPRALPLHAALHTRSPRPLIRDYRPSDFETLWRIDQLCFPEGISYTQVELSGFIRKRNAITLVAETADPEPADIVDAPNLAGFVVAQAIRHKYARVITLDIAPHARRHGLATSLMDACETRLRAAGCSEVYLETAVDNEPALRLYRKLGYQVLGVLPEYYASHSLDAFQMGKRL